ncbi:uncharacterized protein I303_104809 [Kwoniella dejecticola CBS 10117]|uniref:Uncharacterized protein n=1 Tax=Kwoniella dejecticola CBS 10117 TaxID=1296121 RepID=A0A1A6A4C0_9TREE|nr:uncharacterized protein I303_04210 [Kwoniella dejecticola CBS 10117]OBR84888.1 hypothetical protein I303_04210 [Kwoniella dejecticola CBS 10117]
MPSTPPNSTDLRPMTCKDCSKSGRLDCEASRPKTNRPRRKLPDRTPLQDESESNLFKEDRPTSQLPTRAPLQDRTELYIPEEVQSTVSVPDDLAIRFPSIKQIPLENSQIVDEEARPAKRARMTADLPNSSESGDGVIPAVPDSVAPLQEPHTDPDLPESHGPFTEEGVVRVPQGEASSSAPSSAPLDPLRESSTVASRKVDEQQGFIKGLQDMFTSWNKKQENTRNRIDRLTREKAELEIELSKVFGEAEKKVELLRSELKGKIDDLAVSAKALEKERAGSEEYRRQLSDLTKRGVEKEEIISDLTSKHKAEQAEQQKLKEENETLRIKLGISEKRVADLEASLSQETEDHEQTVRKWAKTVNEKEKLEQELHESKGLLG